jgi:hypothetical protein
MDKEEKEMFVDRLHCLENQQGINKRIDNIGFRLGFDTNGNPTGNGLMGKIERAEDRINSLEKRSSELSFQNIMGRVFQFVGGIAGTWALFVALVNAAGK